MELQDPAVVVGFFEGVEGVAKVLDGLEAPEPEQVLLEDADEALDAAVALGLANERRLALEAEEVELALEVVGDELAAVIVAQPGAGGDRFAEGTEAVVHGLAQRLQGVEAGGPAGGMDAQALAGTLIDDYKDRGSVFAGRRRREIGAPHLVDALGADRAVVGAGPA